ncbi:MAG: prepilin-type N-terminal cleavage/methylation domain-containing protein [Armatimonadota bacterium]
MIKRKKKNSGYTLAEVLVTMAVFSMVMSAVIAVYIKGLNLYRERGENVNDFRLSSVAFERITNDIVCNAEKLEYPFTDPDREPSLSLGTPFIVFTSYAKDTVCYQLDTSRNTILRYLYKNFNPNDPSSAQIVEGSVRTIARDVVFLEFRDLERSYDLISVYMSVKIGDKVHNFATTVITRALK